MSDASEETPLDETWRRLEVLVQDADVAAALIWRLGALGVEVQDRETYMEGVTFAPIPEGWARLIAFFAADEAHDQDTANEIMSALDAAGMTSELVSFADYDDRSWETAWKEFFKPLRLSRRSTVGPPWEDFEAPPEGTKVIIEPGMAFGTGTHETTQLCAQILDDLLDARAPSSVLDVGCGSAILSIVAAHLGASPVIGTDVDAHAVSVARENLAINGVADQVSLSTIPVQDIEGTFDIVVANIIAHILLTIEEPLKARVGPGDSLILGGITELSETDILKAFVVPGWRLIERRQAGEWISMHLVREAEESSP